MLRRPSRSWSRSEKNNSYVISRYSLAAGYSPYTVQFWMRCLILSSIMAAFASMKFATTLVHRIKNLPNNSHPAAFSLNSDPLVHHFDYSLTQIKSGVSLVAACQNDHEKLRRSLPTWIGQSDVDEIVIVDWGSEPPLRYIVEEVDIDSKSHAPVHIVHVEEAGKWIASQALNFAFQAAQYSFILKVSCSHELELDFVEHHQLQPNTFVVGGSHLERIRDEEVLKEILFVPRKQLIDLGGYDERLSVNGGEQEDLVERLVSTGMRRIDLNYDKVVSNHVHDEDSTSSHSARVEMEIDLELKKKMPTWNPNNFNESAILGRKVLEEQCRTTRSFRHPLVYYSVSSKPKSVASFRQSANLTLLQTVEQTVFTRNLHSDFSLPRCFSNSLSVVDQRHLLISLYNRKTSISETKLIIVDCFSDFLSRINLLLSGLTISRQTGRVLVVIWEKIEGADVTSFHRTFKVPHNTVLLEDYQKQNVSYREKCQGKSFSSHVAVQSAGHRPITLAENLQNLVYLKTDKPVYSRDIKLLNERLKGKELTSMRFAEKIENDLRHLKDLGLESSIGVFIGSYSEGKNNSHIDKLKIFTSVQEELENFKKEGGMIDARVYIDAESSFVRRFHKVEKNRIDNSWLLKERNNTLAFSNILTRIVALSRTKRFTSAFDDETTKLVRLMRRS